MSGFGGSPVPRVGPGPAADPRGLPRAAQPVTKSLAPLAVAVVVTTSAGDAAASTASSPLAKSTRKGMGEMQTKAPAEVPTPAAPPLPPGALLTPSAVAAPTKGAPRKGAKSRGSGS